ncbi:hypothetical protein N39L_07770 [Limnospira platensis NIES-39]|uniref:Uncharacterized protein n=2 Tax=Limnospira platensis TaxID=118562 RepID=A0A5M3TCJ6_LIMPL|nr:hypothetical protein AP285_03520 [Arthrospira platensis YZ]KDR55481.1 hypothetical protein APPUASWS_023040 [Arthrospira platensis str. Paraca]BAI88655.1 hypothetical protein NIES39_A08170 [Arthrospira platensis NIES-39]BDT11054.1 hypothetical protein N39L_07770 [Arthrospira platensis NIES-39]GCE95751.1 hypothetical protein NIES46_38170 [Arthrospira platensis NIES-46]
MFGYYPNRAIAPRWMIAKSPVGWVKRSETQQEGMDDVRGWMFGYYPNRAIAPRWMIAKSPVGWVKRSETQQEGMDG